MQDRQNSPSKIPSRSSPKKINQSNSFSPSKVNSSSKQVRIGRKSSGVSSPPVAQSITDAQSLRSQRSIVETVEEKVDPKIIEEKNKNKLSKIINESPLYEKDANSPTLFYVEIGPTLQISSLYNLSHRLIVLRLTGTDLSKPSIPYIESLRTLFLDQCKLKTLVGFPLYPKLRYLNLSKNSLETFKGFPVCPDLEELDIRNNKVEFDVDLALAAIASVSMNVYNGEKINEDQIRKSFSRSPLIGYSLRQGFPVFTSDSQSKKGRRKSKGRESTDEDDSKLEDDANNFLIRHLLTKLTPEGITTASLLVNNDSSTITLPIKGKDIKWFVNIQPSAKQPSEWESVPKSVLLDSDRKTGNKRRQILLITQMMYQHLIRCEFSLPSDNSNVRYSMYTLNVIGSQINEDKKELILPFPINPQVTGEPYEGSLVSLVPMPVPCHVMWSIEEKLISKEVNSIRLLEEYIGYEVTCYLQPYCRNMPEITFTHLAAKTNPVERLNPVVTNVYFPDDIIEGVEVQFTPLVFPKREGESKISIERAVSPSGNWETISELQPFQTVYTPTIDDVGCFLRVRYLPILNDGTMPIDNKAFFFYSKTRVIPGFPTFSKPMIAGDPRSGHSLVAIANYSGGRKGQCSYKWFRSSKKISLNGERSISLSKMKGCEEIKDEKTAVLNLTKPLVGFYLAVEMIPIRNDDTIGEKVVAVLNTPISQGENLTPLKKVPPNDQIVAYKLINVKIPVTWYRTNVDWRESKGASTGFEKILVGPEYYPTDRDVGQYLRLVAGNGESDMIIGEVKPSIPFIYNFKLNIKGRKTEVGSVAEVPQKAISYVMNDGDEKEDDDGDGYSDDEDDRRPDNTYLKGVPKAALGEYYEGINRKRKVEIVWVRITRINVETNDTIERVVDIDTPTYEFTKDDVNSQIKAVIYPLDDDGNRFPPTHSEPTKEIKVVKVKQPKIKGELKVDGILTLEFNDLPIYSVTWERTMKMKWEPVYKFTFSRFKKGKNDSEEEVPLYKRDDGKEYTRDEIVYVVRKQDVDYHIQAELVAGEVKEINDQKDPNKVIKVIVPSKQIHGTLKSSLATASNVVPNSAADKTFAMMERVVPKDLHISVKESIFNEPITEGQEITITVEGVDSSGKKPEILWEYKTTETKKKGVYDKWVPLYKGKSHKFTNDDIDKLFRVRCSNTNEVIEIGTIEPSPPTISDFTIKQDSNGSIVILNAQYNGGVEGKSLYFYSVSTPVSNTINNTTTAYSFNDEDLSYIDNATLNIKKLKKVVKVDDKNNADGESNVRMFTPAKEMFNKRIDIAVVPVRSDGFSGKIHWSSDSIIVKSIPIIDAIMNYPNGDMDHLQVGMPLTCVVTKCSIKNCSYRYTWKRYTPISNNNGNNEDDENNFKKEQIKSSSTINDSSSYNLRQIDNGCFIVCQIIAVAENGFVSPIFILDSYQIILPNTKDYTISISIPSRQGVADVKSTKRASGSLARSDKLDGEVDTGDTLKPVINPQPNRNFVVQYEWQVLSNNNNSSKKKKKGSKKQLSQNSSSSNFNENEPEYNENGDNVDDEANDENSWLTVSNDDSYTCSVLDLGCMIRCICTIEGKNYSDVFESIPIGPVKINPKIEAPARAIIRANSFKIRGKAPNGNGQWDLLMNSQGITIKKKTNISSLSSSTRPSNNEQTVKWPNIVCNLIPDEMDQIEITTGPAMRIIIVPELVDKRMVEMIPRSEIRDFCIFIINQFKKKNSENVNSGK